MRYVVIGAGAVGGTIAVRLHHAGRDVAVVARGAHLTVIREHGLTLRSPGGEQTAKLPAYDDPSATGHGGSDRTGRSSPAPGRPSPIPARSSPVAGQSSPAPEQPSPSSERPLLTPETVLVLAVKSQDTEAVLRNWADLPVTGGGTAAERLPLLTAQNGVANEPAAARLFERVHPVCVWLPATHLEPGVVLASGHPYPGMLHLGTYPHGVDDTTREISADLVVAGFLAPVRDDVMRWKYGKLLSNLGNAVEALFGRESGAGPTREVYAAVRAEGEAVLTAAGIAYPSRAEEVAERGDRIQAVPVGGQARQGGSTWQSLTRGTGSVETDYLNGEIVLLGRRYAVPTPANSAVRLAMRRAVREGIPAGAFPRAELGF